MKIEFTIEGQNLRFRRNWFTGRASLDTPDGCAGLSDPYSPSTHFSLSLTKSWLTMFRTHAITIEKVRPLFMAGFRPQSYRVLVDDTVVASARGY
jgi:hypothetical protein